MGINNLNAVYFVPDLPKGKECSPHLKIIMSWTTETKCNKTISTGIKDARDGVIFRHVAAGYGRFKFSIP